MLIEKVGLFLFLLRMEVSPASYERFTNLHIACETGVFIAGRGAEREARAEQPRTQSLSLLFLLISGLALLRVAGIKLKGEKSAVTRLCFL